MQEAEPPECPVCLQPYDTVSAIPRVLNCGHTTCEACLKLLPNPFPNTIRCTVCTVLVKFPNCPSNLPKNIDLLHFSSSLLHHQPEDKKVISSSSSPPPKNEKNQSLLLPLIPKSWSYEFYRKWKKWVLRKDSILIEETCGENDRGVVCGKVVKCCDSDDDDSVMGCFMRENDVVGLIKVGFFKETEEDSKVFECSYESRIVSVLCGIDEKKRNDLAFVLNATRRVCNVGKVYGFWYNGSDCCVYMVFEKCGSPGSFKCLLKKKEDEAKCLSADEMRSLAMHGMDICESLSSLHSEGLVIGCLGASCFKFDGFGRAYLDLGEVLNMGMRVTVAVRNGSRDLDVSLKDNLADKNFLLISPEILTQFLVDGFEMGGGKSGYEVGTASDIWSLACLLVWLIIGIPFDEEMETFLLSVVSPETAEKGSDYSGLYASWQGRIVALLRDRLGEEYDSLREILCRCLEFDPRNRPLIPELWKCLREVIIKPKFDIVDISYQEVKKENAGHRIVLVKLCTIVEETKKEYTDGLSGKDGNEKADGKLAVGGDFIEGLSRSNLKCVEMKGHLDCISGLAVGGGFLFSSSYDKMVHVWSLQDFTLVHSFKGHEHRITAVVFVDAEQSLCISGDNESLICIWEARFPFSDMPIKKLNEQKDWRYSGIHAMAVSGTEYLYTGSGDKLVKAWSLKDYTLSCSMSGHKSVVSSLVVCNGVLYSGSWDGTVRLWSLSDHSPLAVLGEDNSGKVSSILSLSAEQDLLIVGQENGSVRLWHNDIFLKSAQTHKGAVFSVGKKGKWLFSGGWDKAVSVQEISEDANGMDVTPVGSIPCSSTITVLMYYDGKLIVGQADRIIKVYYGV